MRLIFTSTFRKSFDKRNRRVQLQIVDRIELFKTSPEHPLLKDHPLTGVLKGFRSFSVSGDLRIHYEYLSDEEISLLDIGTHSELYG